MRILIVDDEPNIRRALRLGLEEMGHDVKEEASGPGARHHLENQSCDLALVDLRLVQESGLDLLERLMEGRPRLAVVIIAAHASLDTAVDAMRRGAFDVLFNPFSPAQIRAMLERVTRMRSLRDRVADLESRVRDEVPEVGFDSPDPRVRRTLEQARRIAPSDTTLLIRGENGTGKGVLARALHAWSRRAEGPFVTVTCSGLSPELLESELFGYSRGALTGAIRDVDGKVAAAEGGTLFLDEVGDLPVSLQPKLLRFLQERKYERVGKATAHGADVRMVVSTSHNLEAAVASGTFREDLLHRLKFVELTLPPLRHRTDIPALADHLLAFFARRTGRRLTGFTPEAREIMAHYSWPANLCELRNAVERAAILAEGPEVGLVDLPERIAWAKVLANGPIEVGRRVSLERLEAEHIRRILGNSASLDGAAQVLGIDPSTLYRKRKKLGL